jgi:hypothetical protein
MSTILSVHAVREGRGWWLILGCGHWYKWTGSTRPRVDSDLPCPSCSTVQVISPEGATDR